MAHMAGLVTSARHGVEVPWAFGPLDDGLLPSAPATSLAVSGMYPCCSDGGAALAAHHRTAHDRPSRPLTYVGALLGHHNMRLRVAKKTQLANSHENTVGKFAVPYLGDHAHTMRVVLSQHGII